MKTKKRTLIQRLGIISLLIGIALAWWVYRALPRLSIEKKTELGLTPTQIQSIRDIGQWEFLAVSNEELVDTMRRGIFTDDHLVRIYYGTLRLGLDLSELTDNAFSTEGDSLVVMLPPIKLLDDDFIDEARTKAFHESGRWQAADRDRLYQKARRQMLAHSLTRQNITAAEENAETQLRQLLRSMGFKNVVVYFSPGLY